MTECNFNNFSLPDFLLADIEKRIITLRSELHLRNPAVLIEPLRRLSRVRGNFAFDLISSIAWAAEVVCKSAADSQRTLTALETQSLLNAFDAMDRARRTAALSAAA
jgi:hypothetical protein